MAQQIYRLDPLMDEPTQMVESLPCVYPLCPHEERTSIIEVTTASIKRWKGGADIQVAFPYLSIGVRETTLSGFHSECFDAIFADDEEDGD